MNPPEFRLISDAEAEQIERTAHNPPVFTDDFTANDFSEEWWDIRAKLKRRLDIFGDEWTLSNDSGDYLLSESHGCSRWIYVTLRTTKLWRPEFSAAMVDFLQAQPLGYRIACINEPCDEELFDYPTIYLVYSPTFVLARAIDLFADGRAPGEELDCDETLRRFGFFGTSVRKGSDPL